MIVQAFIRNAIGAAGSFADLTGIVLQKTVAQMQTLAAANGFTAGQIYQITNAYSSTAIINIKAYSTSVLEDYGFGTFKNSVMATAIECFMWYELIQDRVDRVYDPIRNNDVKQRSGTSILNYVFDSFNAVNNVIEDCTLIGMDSSEVLNGCYFGVGSTINLSGTDFQLTNCRIGAGKTFDLSGLASDYIRNGKIYEGNISTFDIISTDSAAVNPDGNHRIFMTTFPFAGILRVDDNTNYLSNLIDFPSDHKVVIAPTTAATALVIKDAAAVGGVNIYMETSGTTITLNGNNSDFLEFQAFSNDATKVQKINGYIRA